MKIEYLLGCVFEATTKCNRNIQLQQNVTETSKAAIQVGTLWILTIHVTQNHKQNRSHNKPSNIAGLPNLSIELTLQSPIVKTTPEGDTVVTRIETFSRPVQILQCKMSFNSLNLDSNGLFARKATANKFVACWCWLFSFVWWNIHCHNMLLSFNLACVSATVSLPVPSEWNFYSFVLFLLCT